MGRPKFKLVDVSKLQASKSDGSSSKDEPIEVNTGDGEPLLSTQSSVPTEAEEENILANIEEFEEVNLLDLEEFGPMMM